MTRLVMMVPATLVVLVLIFLIAPLLQRTAFGVQRQTMRRAWQALDEEFLVEAPVAYKTAQVMVHPDSGVATLVGITAGVAYGADASAVCPRRGCDPPGLDCHCGFYAFKRRGEAVGLFHETLTCNGLRHKALLTVTLEGNVLEYEHGYRAQHQTVLSIAFSGLCHRCEQQGFRRPARLLAAAPAYRTLDPAGLGLRAHREPLAAAMPVRPVCMEHLPTSPSARTLTLGELSGLLAAEVQWLGSTDAARSVLG